MELDDVRPQRFPRTGLARSNNGLFSLGRAERRHPASRTIMLEELLLEGCPNVQQQQSNCREHEDQMKIT